MGTVFGLVPVLAELVALKNQSHLRCTVGKDLYLVLDGVTLLECRRDVDDVDAAEDIWIDAVVTDVLPELVVAGATLRCQSQYG